MLYDETNATIADGEGVGTIFDSDPEPTLEIDDVSVSEGDQGTSSATFTVTLSGKTDKSVTVDYSTSQISASPGLDYTTVSGTLTFAPDPNNESRQQEITVPILGDTTDEPDEQFRVTLSDPTNATISDNEGIGTIEDDDITVVNDQAYTGYEYPITIDVLANDSDVTQHPLTIVAVTQGTRGSVTFSSGSVTYTPDVDFVSGTDTFQYTVSDGLGQDTGQVSVTMVQVSDYMLEWQMPDETWQVISGGEAAWDDDILRWSAQYSPNNPPTATSFEWLCKPWADVENPAVPWQTYATALGDGPAEGTPGEGDWGVLARAFFDGFANQVAFWAKNFPTRSYIASIKNTEWVGIDPDQCGSTNLEPYPAGSGAYRIFPERNSPGGEIHDLVKVSIELQRPVPGGYFATVHFGVFDPDHYQDGGPANTATDGDPNDHNPNSHQPKDNYGTGVGMLPLTGQLIFLPGQGLKLSDDLRIKDGSRQPGNNFIVGASGRQPRLNNYRFRDSDGTTLIRIQGTQETVIPEAEQTPMLTVWRTLWMELDDMVAPTLPGDGPFDGAGVGNDDVQIDPWEPAIALATTNLAAALVRVQQLPAQYDPRDAVDFVHNLNFNLMQTKGNAARDVWSERNFWVVQLIGAYEAGLSSKYTPPPGGDDFPDYDGEPFFLLGYDSGGTADAPLFVFLETIRDVATNLPGTVPQGTLEARVALHETLHGFLGRHGGGHGEADEGIMDGQTLLTGTVQQNQLTPRQIRVIQERVYPGHF